MSAPQRNLHIAVLAVMQGLVCARVCLLIRVFARTGRAILIYGIVTHPCPLPCSPSLTTALSPIALATNRRSRVTNLAGQH